MKKEKKIRLITALREIWNSAGESKEFTTQYKLEVFRSAAPCGASMYVCVCVYVLCS